MSILDVNFNFLDSLFELASACICHFVLTRRFVSVNVTHLIHQITRTLSLTHHNKLMSTRKLSSIYNITRPPRSTPTFLAQVAAPARRTLALPAHLITHTSVLTAANLGALETKVGFSAFWNNQAYFKKMKELCKSS